MTRYDAFLSYKSSSSGRAARRLNRHLLTISKRHRDQRAPRIFHDQFALPPGRLREALLAAVRESRHLVVLIDREVAGAEWVTVEIEEWLRAGGTADRLFLVRTDRAADLSWDPGRNTFTDPDVLPAPLRTLFTAEQAYIDYPPWALVRPDDKLARLCGTLTGSDPKDYLVAEAEIQRRRNRVTTTIAATLAVFLIAAVFFGIRSVVNERAANRNAAEAFAQADAAEALLAAADSPTRAIELAVRAAKTSDSTTVRSAMLAVSQQARRLRRAFAYPEDRAGHPLAAAAFSPDGTRLVAWGPGPRDGTSYLQIWDIPSGAAEFGAVLEAPAIDRVVRVNQQVAAACGGRGPVLIRMAGQAATVAALPGSHESCETRPVQSGAVVLAGDTASFVDRQGHATAVAGVSSVATHPRSRYALAAGPSGSHVLRGGRWTRIGDAPAEARTADPNGRFLSRLGATAWQFVEQGRDGPVVRAVRVPPSAVDVVALARGAALTGDLMWVDGTGVVGWTGDRSTTRVGNSEGITVWRSYATRLAALDGQDAVVINGSTATVVRSPGAVEPSNSADGEWQAGDSPGWSERVIRRSLGSAQRDGQDPLVGRCLDGQAVFVAVAAPDAGSLALSGYDDVVELSGRGMDGGGCDVVAAGAHLDVWKHPLYEPVRLRDTVVAGSVVPGPKTGQIAIVRSGVPLEILSTEEAESLPRPWNVSRGGTRWPAAFGTRRVDETVDGLDLVEDGRPTTRVPVPGLDSIVATRPDGRGGAAILYDKRLVLIDETTVTEAATGCRGGRVEYLPQPSYAESAAAAAAQVPVVRRGDGSVLDCRTGRVMDAGQAPRVLQYDVGPDRGLLVTRSGTATMITRWAGGEPTSVDGPPLPGEDARVTVGDRAEDALVFVPGDRRVSLQRRADGRWTTVLDLVPNLPDVAAALLIDGGTLLLTVGSGGGFELHDVATGRLLASDPTASGGQTARRAAALRRGDDIFVYLAPADPVDAIVTIRVPVGIPALTAQLCGLYRAAACPAAAN